MIFCQCGELKDMHDGANGECSICVCTGFKEEGEINVRCLYKMKRETVPIDYGH